MINTAHIPIDLYDIRIYDHDATLRTVVHQYSRLEYHQRLNAPWNHQITIETTEEFAIATLLRELAVKPDWFILIYRTDPLTNNKDLVYEGFNQTVVDQSRTSGDLIFNLYGVGYTQLLNRRVVIPTLAQEYSEKTGFAESLMKAYVEESAVNPVTPARIMPNLLVEPDLGRGSYVPYKARYVKLSTVVENLSNDGNIDFGIVGTDPPTEFIFQARELWGKDRRIDNTDGNPPLVFDQRYGNMEIPIMSTNFSEEYNYAYVGGAGAGVDREIIQVSRPDAIALSPWGRRESFTDARHQDETDSLYTAGLAYLDHNEYKNDLTFNVRQTRGSRWIRDWGLGDLINAYYGGRMFEKKIDEVSVTVVPAGDKSMVEVISAELSDIE